MSVVLPDPEDELYVSILKSIMTFDFGDYGFDDVEETKSGPGAPEWIHDLAKHIDKDWCEYIDGVWN